MSETFNPSHMTLIHTLYHPRFMGRYAWSVKKMRQNDASPDLDCVLTMQCDYIAKQPDKFMELEVHRNYALGLAALSALLASKFRIPSPL
jgi:hypothetical protein